ncbi:hypothetical protein G6011_10115 [Alternaria panax]|uniref:Uncharacterized protein n=1 Tax=Alternaria panax TaxID=48097 RepID=A0AAD4FC19_9PLEO|nr:hypothetical protein G6011_10115 [Alternaria panax]
MRCIDDGATNIRNGKGEQAVQKCSAYHNEQKNDCDVPCPFHELEALSINNPTGIRGERTRSWVDGVQPFGSLEALCSLTKLTIDDHLLSSTDSDDRRRPIEVLNPQAMLPTSLQSLSITGISSVGIMNAEAALRLGSFELDIEIGPAIGWTADIVELEKFLRCFLPVVIEALYCRGTAMRVCRQDNPERRLWFEPGSAVPDPHWN